MVYTVLYLHAAPSNVSHDLRLPLLPYEIISTNIIIPILQIRKLRNRLFQLYMHTHTNIYLLLKYSIFFEENAFKKEVSQIDVNIHTEGSRFKFLQIH